MSEPIITCILVSHKKPGFVDQAIASVQAQVCPRWQLIVMDSGSLLKAGHFSRCGDDQRILVVDSEETEYKPATSAPQAWCINECFRRGLVRGELVCYLCDDDLYYPLAFMDFVFAAQTCPEDNAWYGSADVLDGERHIAVLRADRVGDAMYSLDCRADGMQVCHRVRTRVEWPEAWEAANHADGVFLDNLGRLTPIIPLIYKVGAHRRTALSTFTKASQA